jgi:O-antigen ligase
LSAPKAIGWVAFAAAALLPVIYAPNAQSPFGMPKTVLLRFAAIVIASIAAIAWLWGKARFDRERLRDPEVWLPLAIVVWSAITTLASTNVQVSAFGLLYVVCVVILYAGLRAGLREIRTPVAIAILIAPALINTFTLALQYRSIWTVTPLDPSYAPRQRLSGFFGNPDYLAVYLVAPLLLCLAAGIAFRDRRWRYFAAAVPIALGVIVTQSITALAAVAAGIAALAIVANWRRAAAAVVVLAIAGAMVLAFYPPMRARVDTYIDAWGEADTDRLISGRTAAWIAAWEMFTDHPITGVGVHVYQYEFLPYRIRADREHHDALRFASKGTNFGEAHNDHLEILAETGLPGYALFLAVLFFVARRTFRATADEPHERFGRVLAVPLTVSFAVLALAQFPISIPAAIVTWMCVALLAVRA